MKLWKILVATMIALLLVGAVAMADECEHNYVATQDTWTKHVQLSDGGHRVYTYTTMRCNKCAIASYVQEVAGNTGTCNQDVEGEWQDATCDEPAYRINACSYCGRTAKETWGSKLGHADAYKYVKGNCLVKSADVYYCSREGCGKELARVEYDTEAHAFDKVWSTQQTCTQDGYYTMVCKVCGKDDGTGIYHVPASAHDWKVYETKASTCTVKGWETKYCPWCGATKTEDLKLAAHTWSWVNEVAANCGKDGMKGHNKCTKCGALSVNGKDIVSADSLVLPKKSGGHVVDTLKPISNIITTCDAYNNYKHAYCAVCGVEFDTPIPAKDHTYPAIKWDNRVVGPATNVKPECTEAGSAIFACKDCGQQKTFTIPATGHDWSVWKYGTAADCLNAMTASRKCENCKATETITVKPALGHTWVEVKGTEATCTTAGKVDRKCAVCDIVEYGMTIPAKGHSFTKVVETVKPTCDAQGYTVLGCANCDATQKGNYTAALGHAYSWVVVTKPSESGSGKNEYTCGACGDVADTKTVKYSKYYYNNTMTSFGPTTKELVGGNDWYRVTPVDLTVDGVYTYDLIASNKYVVGTVTITVNAGTLSVSYKAKYDVEVKDETLLIYASKADLAAGSAVTAPVGAAINVAETFGADTKVLVSLILTGNYDAAGKGYVDAAAASAMIANID